MYDCIIIGCGVSGMTAAIYLTRSNKKVLILEKETIGGQIASSPKVENFPGFKSISGVELANNLYEQVLDLGASIELEEVLEVKPGKEIKVVTDENTYKTKTLIIATGSKYRLLGLENEINLIGNGISFCVACDGAFYKDKIVAVIGGGNSAVINALALSEMVEKLYVIQNLEDLTAETIMADKLRSKENVEIICNSVVTKLNGEDELASIEIDTKGKLKTIKLDGMFISIGQQPETKIFEKIIDINKYNYFASDDCKTKLDNVFVSGDCRDKKVRQLTTAVSDGTIAALEAIKYLDK